MYEMKAYLSCPLTLVPDTVFGSFIDHVRTAVRILRDEFAFEVSYALENSDPCLADHEPHERPRLCYDWDRKMVEDADVVVAECSFPSTGAGIELQTANDAGIPIVLVYSDCWRGCTKPKPYRTEDGSPHELQIGNGIVSIMAQGLPMVKDEIRYETAESFPELFKSRMKSVLSQLL